MRLIIKNSKVDIILKNVVLLPFLLLLIGFSYLIYHIHSLSPPHFVVSAYSKCDLDILTTRQNKLSKYNICNGKKQFSSELIPQPDFLAAAHAATLEVLPNGHLLALWFAGSHEGQPDVKIWQSEYDGTSWGMARAIVTPQLLTQTTDRFVKKVGNPVIYQARDGVLHLFVVSVSLIGGWSASNINHFISTDMAKTWQGGQRLMLSPFFNLSTLVRTNAISLSDGGFYLPVYHELMRHYTELLRFDKDGNFIRQIRISGHKELLQPAILTLTDTEAMAFMRNKGKTDKILYYQTTDDGGISWSEPEPTNLTNQDSSLAVANITSRLYLMIHNSGDRAHLAVAVSNNGKEWHDVYSLENTKNKEFSYPALKVHDGIVDILYTWNRSAIKHVQFNLSWLGVQINHGDINAN